MQQREGSHRNGKQNSGRMLPNIAPMEGLVSDELLCISAYIYSFRNNKDFELYLYLTGYWSFSLSDELPNNMVLL
jgi:hypothetical protein